MLCNLWFWVCKLSSSDKCVHFISHTNWFASQHCYWHWNIFKRISCTNIKYPNLCTSLPSEHVSTVVTKVMLTRVISHNSSQMDSPEIKSASQTASWEGNIPLQFFIDLHRFSPWYFPRFTPPSPFSPSLPSVALSGASLCVFDDEWHNIHQVRRNVWKNTLTHIPSPQIGIQQLFCCPLLDMGASEKY